MRYNHLRGQHHHASHQQALTHQFQFYHPHALCGSRNDLRTYYIHQLDWSAQRKHHHQLL